MGQTLSSPSTKKHCESGSNRRFLYGMSEMQGWRIAMEDAHVAILDLDETEDGGNTFFAVYDGHGGSSVAKFAGHNVHRRLRTEESYKEGNWELALKKAFLGTDEDILANPAHTRDPSGCTAVAALITPDNKIYVANAGDSRSVLSVKGEVKPLSFDHKPTNSSERSRILNAGGYVEYGRVNGNLALSRALGDFEFKKNYALSPEAQIITADPDVTLHEIVEEDEFIVLACDGIWDCLSSQQVVDFVRYQVSEGKELTDICEMMCDHCLAPDTTSGVGIGCDNMTVLIVAISHGRSKEEWYEWIKDRVKTEHGYITPSTLPQLYSQSRLLSFKARREAQEARERMKASSTPSSSETSSKSSFDTQYLPHGITLTTIFSSRMVGAGANGVSNVDGAGAGGDGGGSGSGGSGGDGGDGGISYQPGGNIVSDSGQIMFGKDDSDDEDSGEEDGSGSFFTRTFGLGRSNSPDPAKNLREQLAEFEKENEINREDADADADANLHNPHKSPSETHTEKISSPVKLPNGDAKGTPEPVEIGTFEATSPSVGEVPVPNVA